MEVTLADPWLRMICKTDGNEDEYVLPDIYIFACLFRFRFTQTAVASFGVSPSRQSQCGLVPAGFTRLTPEVLNWVKKTAGMYHAGINDPGESLHRITMDI